MKKSSTICNKIVNVIKQQLSKIITDRVVFSAVYFTSFDFQKLFKKNIIYKICFAITHFCLCRVARSRGIRCFWIYSAAM